MRVGIFVDIDCLVKLESKVWIVDKNKANMPLLKISQSDFNLIKSGIFKNQGNKVDFNGQSFWLPTTLWNQIKVKCKNYNVNPINIAISLQEFLNKDLIESKNYEINKDVLNLFINEDCDFYIVCPRQVKSKYERLFLKIKDELEILGIVVRSFYFISENFMNQNDDDIRFKKTRLLLQHLSGHKTDGDHFIDEEITRYDMIHYYDINADTLNITKDINNTLEYLMSKTENNLREIIKEDIEDFKPTLWCHKINSNQLNRIENKKVILNISKIVRTFENFNLLF